LKLRDFYLGNVIVFWGLFFIFYLTGPASEGFWLPLLIEGIFAIVIAIIPTMIYFIMTKDEK